VHIAAADLSDADAIPGLADQVRAEVGDLEVLYYAPTPDEGFVPAADLTSERAREFMPLVFYRLLDIVRQFLPSMLERGTGAVLTAQGASSVRGLPDISGPGPAQAAQRNYLQSLHAEMIDKGIYVGMIYVGAIIESSAFHTWTTTPEGSVRNWGPTVDPDDLADLLWNMHKSKNQAEVCYPEDMLER
jgi:short-subunit dehydrogenase